jgi:hypothetical protein
MIFMFIEDIRLPLFLLQSHFPSNTPLFYRFNEKLSHLRSKAID